LAQSGYFLYIYHFEIDVVSFVLLMKKLKLTTSISIRANYVKYLNLNNYNNRK